MKRKRFSEEQIIGVLKEYAAGASMAELSRRHGVSENTLYRWKARYGGMEVSEARRLRDLEAENTKLKRRPPGSRPPVRPPGSIRPPGSGLTSYTSYRVRSYTSYRVRSYI